MSTPRPRPTVVTSERNDTISPLSSIRMNGPSTEVPPQAARRYSRSSFGLPSHGGGESFFPCSGADREIGLNLSLALYRPAGRLRWTIYGGNAYGGQPHQRSRRRRRRVNSAERHRWQGRPALLPWVRHPRPGRPDEF